jgi:hypothetical protein
MAPAKKGRKYLAEFVIKEKDNRTGGDLVVRRGDPGKHPGTGKPRTANTSSTTREANDQELRAAAAAADYLIPGSGTAVAEALMALGETTLIRSEIVLGPGATGGDWIRLHELGHVEQLLLDPINAIRQADEAQLLETLEEYDDSASEQYANDFASKARKKDEG